MKERLKALSSGDPIKSKEAEEALKTALPSELLPELLALAIDTDNFSVAESACNVVASFRENAVIASFLKARLQSKDRAAREGAAWVLSHAPQGALLAQIEASAESDVDEAVRISCLNALRKYAWNQPDSEARFTPIWLRATEAAAPGVRGAGFECLSHVRDRKLDAVLERALTDADQMIRNLYARLWLKNGGRQA